MKLADLNPHWFTRAEAGDVVGLTFDCPCCRTQRIGIEFDAGIDKAHRHPDVIYPVPPDGHFHWHRVGETFDDLTLTPSVDASAHGHWHGWIIHGEAK